MKDKFIIISATIQIAIALLAICSYIFMFIIKEDISKFTPAFILSILLIISGIYNLRIIRDIKQLEDEKVE